MTKVIRSRQDLLDEKQRLKNLLMIQKQQINFDVVDIKKELQPAFTLLSVVGKLTSRESRTSTLLSTGSALAIEWIAQKFFRKNLLFRWFLPPLLKNVSSHLLYKHTDNGKGLQNVVDKVRHSLARVTQA